MTAPTTAHKKAAEELAWAREKLAWIEERLAEGMTVYVTTRTRATKVTPKAAKRWAADGLELFKIDRTGSLIMAHGRRYDCIDYCRISAIAEGA